MFDGTRYRSQSRARHAGLVAASVLAALAFDALLSRSDAASDPSSDGASTVVVQAGSSGGVVTPPASLGKRDKSISGGESVQPPSAQAPEQPVTAARPKRARVGTVPRETARPAASRCPNIVGVWSSWASGVMGKGDTTFNSDGSAYHRAGIRGRWWCEGGQLHIEWPDGRPGLVTLSADHRQILSSDGRVHMSR